MPMRPPKSKERALSGQIRAGDTIQINLDISRAEAALGDCVWQVIRPLPDKLAIQDNLRSISKVQDRSSQHNDANCSSLTNRR